MKRCDWVDLNNPLYVKYHDTEWGVQVHDDYKLFEFLILEGAQAGLSWSTILNKRENYRRAFDNFDFEKIAKYGETKIEELLGNEGIVRNRLKIKSAVRNAKVFIDIRNEFGSFSNYLWGFVSGEVVRRNYKQGEEIPTRTELSDEISRDLKKRGMSFVGSVIIYSYLQAVGVVNDHEVSCFRFGKV